MNITYMDEDHQALCDDDDNVLLEAIADPDEEFCKVIQYHPMDKRICVSTRCSIEPDKVDIRIFAEEIEVRTPYDTIYFDTDW